MAKSKKQTKKQKQNPKANEEFVETNYDTVLDRICVRAMVPSKLKGVPPKWDNFSLRELREKDQQQLKGWLMRYLARAIFGITSDKDIEEEELIAMVQWMDRSGLPPTRIKEGAFENEDA